MRGTLSSTVFRRGWGRKENSSSLWVTGARAFRSEAALQALQRASEDGDFTLALYNYPSFSAALSALFLRRYYSLRRLPAVILPFSSFEPLREDDLKLQSLKTCYLLDFIGPGHFAFDLSKFIPEVIVFDHRKATAERISKQLIFPENLRLHLNTSKSSARAVYEHFSETEGRSRLFNKSEQHRAENLLIYLEDEDLRRRELPDIGAFKIGLKKAQPNLNFLTNPFLFDQLLNLDCKDLISRGKRYLFAREDAAKKLLGGEFKIRLGRGFYGECLCIRADGHSHLSHEIGDELSKRSAALGLRPIGAVAFMQRGNLKICLRSAGDTADTSEIAKAYGGGGRSGSSSFIIRMDEYGQWALPR